MPTERDSLLAALSGTRHHVLRQLEGLDDEALRRPVLPSRWSCLGLVRHLTLSDERFWFEVVVGGAPLDWWPEGEDGDWRVAADEPAQDVIEAYRAAIAASDAVLAGCSLDDAPLHREDGWGEDDFADVRTVVQHVVVETATHAGQLDAVRELIDGRQHIVL